ncbi:MAG: succinoglycan biosynthesis transport protein ExoP [Paracoccaceae bacterium]
MNNSVPLAETLPVLRNRSMPRDIDHDAVDARATLRVFWKRRWLILGTMMAAGILIFVVLSRVTPTYTVYAVVMLDPRKTHIVTDNQLIADLNPSAQIVNGEIAIIRSNVLIGAVVDNLDPELLDHLDPALKPKSLISQAKIWAQNLISPASPTSLLAAPAITPEELQKNRLIPAIQRKLKVYNQPKSFVITIRFEADDPIVATEVANQITERYIADQLDARKDAVDQATEWLEQRLHTLGQEVETAEVAAAAFRAESLVLDGGTLENATLQLATLGSQLILIRAERADAEAQFEQLQLVVAQDGLSRAAEIVSTPAIDELHAQALDLRQTDAVWARTFDPDQTRRVEIRRELAEITAALTIEVKRTIEVLRSELAIAQSREAHLKQSITETEQMILSISRNQLGLKQLERQASASRHAYETLLTRLTEARTQKQLQQPDAKLIQYATVPEVPSAPRPKLMAAVGAAVTASLTIALVFFNQMTTATFRTVQELESETGLPVLSALPLEPWSGIKAGHAALRANPYSIYGERIRQLRTALLPANGPDKSSSILILSSVPGEGKSMTAVALAEMSALSGKSTILVDFDLRCSTVQKTFGWDLRHDLADFITNKCTFDEAIFSPPGFGFDVLAATGRRHDAVEELSVDWLKPAISELKRVYDTVIIDAPALLAVSDGMILAQVVDTRVYVVEYDNTPRSVVAEGLSKLSKMRLGITGVVFSKLNPRTSPDPYSKGYTYDS